ncbi:MAG: SpoIIE family protein phosphatase [Armatimonadota bacterium]
MTRRRPAAVISARRLSFILLGFIVPGVVTGFIALVRMQYADPSSFLFLYLPVLLFVSYLGGLFPGMIAAVFSTFLADYYFVEPAGLTIAELRVEALPSALFLLSGILIAAAGDQYWRYQDRLRQDLARVHRRERDTRFVDDITVEFARQQDLPVLFDAITKRCTDVLGSWCGIELIANGKPRLKLESLQHQEAGRADRVRSAIEKALPNLDLPVIAQILKSDRPVATYQDEAGTHEVLAQLKVRGHLSVPIKAKGETLGIFVVGEETARRWDDEDLRLAVSIADRVGLAIQNARLLAALRESDARKGAILETGLDAIITMDHDGNIIEFNPAAEVMFGYSREEVLGQHMAERIIPPNLRASHASGLSRYLATGEGPIIGKRVELTAMRCDGSEFPVEVAVNPIHIDDGPPMFTAYVRDITERKQVEIERAQLLSSERMARAAAERDARRVNAVNRTIAIAARSLNLGEVFDEFAEALQMLLPFVRVTMSLYDPKQDWLATRFFKGPVLTAPTEGLEGPKAGTVRGRVLDTGQPYVRRDTLATHEFTEDQLLGSTGIRSYIVVPMTVGGTVIGTLNFGHYEPGFYTEEHGRLIQPIADHLAIAVSHSLLFEQVQRRAGELSEAMQRALLPAALPKVPFVSMEALYRGADPEAKVGGDWYDAILLLDDRLLLGIGDVTGHGIAAAATMGEVRNFVRAYALQAHSPAEILAATNRLLFMLPERPQVSVWIAVFDPFSGDLTYSGAGHPPPYVMMDRQVDSLSATGPPLGLSDATVYREGRVPLSPGARLVAYTDGLIEATRDVVEGERRLVAAIQSTRDEPSGRAVEVLVDRVLAGVQPHDDIAVLILDLLPPGAPLFFSVPAVPENLWRVRRAVRAFAERGGVMKGRAEDIVMAVGEAALNAVEHAYEIGSGNATVHGEQHDNVLTITVRDFGKWKAPIERGRGRGIRIMKSFADTVTTSTGPTGTAVELTWTLDPGRVTG